jgi:type VI protein secretion system component Hcp
LQQQRNNLSGALGCTSHLFFEQAFNVAAPRMYRYISPGSLLMTFYIILKENKKDEKDLEFFFTKHQPLSDSVVRT